MDAARYNQALALTGSNYRVPPAGGGGAAANAQFLAQQEAERKAAAGASGDKAWGLINMAANMYTGGAFGAVTGGVGKDENGNVKMGNLQNGGAGAAGAAKGAAGMFGGGGGGAQPGAMGSSASGGWSPNQNITNAYLGGR